MTSSFNKPPFVVIYWAGGSKKGCWNETRTFHNHDEACGALAAIVAGGRPGYVKSIHELHVVGWPDGPPPNWDFEKLCWKTGKTRKRK